MCQIRLVRSVSGIAICSSGDSGESKRHRWTAVACSENNAKFVPAPSHVAPSGCGLPGRSSIAEILLIGHHEHLMRVSDFDFDLPDELIAQEPRPRGRSRLLVVRRQETTWEEATIADLPALLSPGDLVVANDTRVFP